VKLVLDASVALSWLLEDAGADQVYAVAVFAALREPAAEAHVPAIWGLEVASVIAKSEARGALQVARSEAFLVAVASAPIRCDAGTDVHALKETLQLARRYRLSAYDASYLELALRLSLPIASLDDDLRRAAGKAGVRLLKP
jgi:predicted nucleic acid-binding protein